MKAPRPWPAHAICPALESPLRQKAIGLPCVDAKNRFTAAIPEKTVSGLKKKGIEFILRPGAIHRSEYHCRKSPAAIRPLYRSGHRRRALHPYPSTAPSGWSPAASLWSWIGFPDGSFSSVGGSFLLNLRILLCDWVRRIYTVLFWKQGPARWVHLTGRWWTC